MADSLVVAPQDLGGVQPEPNTTTSSEGATLHTLASSEGHENGATLAKADNALEVLSNVEDISDSIGPGSDLLETSVKHADNSSVMSAENPSDPSNVNISVASMTQVKDILTTSSCDNSSSSAREEEDIEVSNEAAADSQNPDRVDLPGIFAPDHFGMTGSRHSHTRSLSDGSSGSEGECRRMEVSHLDSDTGSSSVSPRDQVSSEVSSEDPLADLETMRQYAGSVMSDASSYSWMREGTMGSMISVDPDSALGRIRADIAALGSGDGAAQPGAMSVSEAEGGDDMRLSTELTNKLVEGPTVTLPPSEPPPTKPLTVTPAAEVQELPVPAHEHSTAQTEAVADRNSNSSDQTRLSESASSSRDSGIAQSGPSPESCASQSPGTSSEPKPMTVAAESTTSASTDAAKPPSPAKQRVKKTPNDFIFGKVIGEGSYSTVSMH